MGHSEAGFCGDYCGKCPNFGLSCDGCGPLSKPECHFILCCLERHIPHCGLCEDFPCEALNAFVPDDRAGCPPGYHIENLRARVEIGTEAWLEKQRERWGIGSQS